MTQHEKYQNKTTTTRSSITSTSSSSSSSSTTTTTTTTGGTTGIPRTRACSILDQIEDIALFYEQCIGTPINACILTDIREYIEHYEISVEVIKLAIRDTALARYPSARYLLAILDRCAGDEICTAEDWKAAKVQRQAEKRTGRMRTYY